MKDSHGKIDLTGTDEITRDFLAENGELVKAGGMYELYDYGGIRYSCNRNTTLDSWLVYPQGRPDCPECKGDGVVLTDSGYQHCESCLSAGLWPWLKKAEN